MKSIQTLIMLMFTVQVAFINETDAQLDDLGTFMSTGVDDAEKLMNGYVSPWINGFGASLAGGWYNTAKTHKPGGFDISITTNVAFVPSDYKEFNVNELELQRLIVAPGEQPESPTIAGKDEQGPQMNYKDFATLKAFDMPEGTKIDKIPSPMAQLSIGLFKDTEITGRWMPKITIQDDNNIGYWGVGLKHGLKQWIPVIERIPFLHLTLQGGYTRLTTNVALSVTPESIGLSEFIPSDMPANMWDDQNMMIQISSWTANVLVSADAPFVSVYGGIGIVNTKSVLKLEGYYPLLGITNTVPSVVASEKDPIDFEVENKNGTATKPRLNIGTRFKFGFFTIHFDYTRATYNVVTAGIGITFR